MSLNLFTAALKKQVASEPLLILQEMKKLPASANSQFQLISNGYKVLRNRQNCLWSVFALKPEVILLCKSLQHRAESHSEACPEGEPVATGLTKPQRADRQCLWFRGFGAV